MKILPFKSLDVNIVKISFSNDCHRSTTWQSSDKKIFKTRIFFFFKKHLDLYASSCENGKITSRIRSINEIIFPFKTNKVQGCFLNRVLVKDREKLKDWFNQNQAYNTSLYKIAG